MIAALLAAAATVGAFDPFVGSCWSADFSATMRDTHCFEVLYDGAHVRDRHEVKEAGKTVYAGETTYSLDGPNTVFTYFNSLGGVGTGKVTRDGGLLRFKGSMRASPEKPPQPIDSEWTIIDHDHYDVRSLVKDASTGGNPVLHFRRVN
jgi:hypothetical protein